MDLQTHFEPFRRQTVGREKRFRSPCGEQRLVYADWTASGRLYRSIEEKMADEFGPLVGNTHTRSNLTGETMTRAYHEARDVIKRHVRAGPDDVLLATGYGMTGAINKLIRILGLKVPEALRSRVNLPDEERPVVFVTHMEHHSNHTSWLETLADVEVIEPDEEGLVDVDRLRRRLERYPGRPKIGSFTACSNVTGIRTPYHQLARAMHEHDGVCFVDFAASAPYVEIDMHPADPLERLDAVFFSPHKFLGGPGSPGIVVFDRRLDPNRVPDHPGGGTVAWTNPWGEHRYVDDLEEREDGGTPGFLQTIRAALAVCLKERMGVNAMLAREEEIVPRAIRALRRIPGLHLLAEQHEDRLGILSFYLDDIHYNLLVRLLNDRYGVQVRGGCACAGTYGHYLLHIDRERSRRITDMIDRGDVSNKPGWVRLSLHPTMTDEEIDYCLDAVATCVRRADEWQDDYAYDRHTNEWRHRTEHEQPATDWFDLGVGAAEPATV